MLMEEKAQVSFEYLLTAVFGIVLAISAAIIIETLRAMAVEARIEILNTREEVINNIIQ